MSVEAAFIATWTFFILVILVYLGFFEYDRCLLFQDGYTIAVGASSKIAGKKEKQNWIDGHIQNQYGEKYIATKSVDKKGTVTSTKIKVKAGFSLNSIPGSNGIIARKLLTASDEIVVDNYSFSQKVRLFRGARRLLSGG